jgi:hypothetical protein
MRPPIGGFANQPRNLLMHHLLHSRTTLFAANALACALLLQGCGGGGDAAPVAPVVPAPPTAAAPLVITLATTADWNGTLSTTTAQYEHGSSDETATAFQSTQPYCRVAAYSLVAANGKKYYLEIPFRKDTKAIGLLKFGDDDASSFPTLARVLNPTSGVSIDIANRRITFTNLVIGTSTSGLTLNGTLDYPTNVAPENRASCG